MLRDLRFAIRVLAARPTFTLVAALSLALGIGVNSAIFSFIDALWFHPMAVPRPGELVRIFTVTGEDRDGPLSYPEFLDLSTQATSLSAVVAIGGRGAVLVEGDSRQLLTLNLVSANFFTALGIRPALGRVFTPKDGSDPLAVVLGNAFWKRHFGGDPNIVGRQLRIQRINDVLVTVIGVLPASFREIDAGADRDLWFAPQSWSRLGDLRELEERGNRWFGAVARIEPGAGPEAANAQVRTLFQRMAQSSPASNKGRSARVVSDLQYRLAQAGTTGLALLAIVLLVVAISSVNVANLLLSRAGSRGMEMALRLSLGAGRVRLVRQLMTENFLLGAAGLVLGLVVGAWIVAILPSLMVSPPGFTDSTRFQFDSRVLFFSLAISLATVALFGLAPAWKSARPDLVSALKGGPAFGVAARRRWPLRHWLVAAQVAISMTLLACAGVLVQSFAHTRTSDLGFGRKQLLLVWMVADDARPALYRDIVARFQGMPGVRSVAVAVRAPLSLSSNGMAKRVTFPGRQEYANRAPFEIKYNSVTPNFLDTMGTPVLRGRGFDHREESANSDAVLINEQMARRFWPNEEPLGKVIQAGGRPRRIVGVVRNAPINAVGEIPEPYLYLPYWSNFEEEATFLIETVGDAAALAQPARRALKAVDSRLDPLTITTENELIRYSAGRFQTTAELVGVLGVLGLLLTAVGLYGVVSYGVGQRTREIGIRMALGAAQADTLRLVLREVGVLALAGIALGLPLALTATRLLTALLFGIGPWDVATFAAAALVLAVALFTAGILPARRATRIEPSSALRFV